MKHVAVIGGGVAGLAAARALADRHRVTLIEAAPRVGGHVRTVDVDGPRGPVAVDTGFIVCNRDGYPRFFAMLDQLGIATRPTSMSFSVSVPGDDDGALEWGSAGLAAVFAQPGNLLRPRHWRLVAAVLRFLRQARRDLGGALTAATSLDEYLAARRVPADVRDRFVVPLAAALWSLAPDRCGDFPAETYLRFLAQHGMLSPVRPLTWQTVAGGSRGYVDALLARWPVTVWTASPARRLHRDGGGVTVEVDGDHRGDHRFDRVVVATHADDALALLAAPDPDEQRVLGAFRYSRNHVVLHTDDALLPRARAARASWNYLADPDTGRVAVTYWMNRLQGLDDDVPYLVTLNPRAPIAPRHLLDQTWMAHPQLDRAALRAQRELAGLAGRHRTYFAGAHLGFGFHEDGMRAGQDAAARLLADAEAAA